MSTNDVPRFEQLFLRMTVSNENDKNGVTATFDRWTNVKMEQLWDIVFITSKEELMEDAKKKKVNIKAFVSDLASEYAAARRQMRRQYSSKIFLSRMAHQINLIFGEIFKEQALY
ncbi:hypothetical protein C1645_837104 [Glomus cerebriforme]|uniref:Uncharacterized protein n=1 Tax=Glomus cerebriforme TaxID=658196 RepID=A0A397SAR5_9GLOM|nr:hypothetical protein C1645_837104 [Glomus cerebriforme]